MCVVCLFCLFNFGILCQGSPFLCAYFNMHISMRPSYLERPLLQKSEISPEISAHQLGAAWPVQHPGGNCFNVLFLFLFFCLVCTECYKFTEPSRLLNLVFVNSIVGA